MDEKTIPREIQESGKESLPLSKKSAERDMRLQFWIPPAVHRQLSEEAVKNGMTLATWTAYVLAKRPVKVVERTLLPKGTKDALAKIPTLEKRVADQTTKWNALVKKHDALFAELARLKKQLGTGKYPSQVKCPSCNEKVEVEVDLSKELGLAEPPDKPKA